eukprot:423706_1
MAPARTKQTARKIIVNNDSVVESNQNSNNNNNNNNNNNDNHLKRKLEQATEPKFKKPKIGESEKIIEYVDLSNDKQNLVTELMNLEKQQNNLKSKQFEDFYQIKVKKGKVVSKMYKKEAGEYTCWKNKDCKKKKCADKECQNRVWKMEKTKKQFWEIMAPIIRKEAHRRGFVNPKLIASKATADRFEGVARREQIGVTLFKENDWIDYQHYMETGKLVKILTFAEAKGIQAARVKINQKVEEVKMKIERKIKQQKAKLTENNKNNDMKEVRNNLVDRINAAGYDLPKQTHKLENVVHILKFCCKLVEDNINLKNDNIRMRNELALRENELVNVNLQYDEVSPKQQSIDLEEQQPADLKNVDLENCEEADFVNCLQGASINELINAEFDLEALIEKEKDRIDEEEYRECVEEVVNKLVDTVVETVSDSEEEDDIPIAKRLNLPIKFNLTSIS